MGTGGPSGPAAGPEQCYGAKTVVEAHNACAGDPYFPFVLDATESWVRFQGLLKARVSLFLLHIWGGLLVVT